MRTLFAALCLMLLPAQALASLCYAFVEDMRRDGWGVQFAQLGAVNVAPRSVKITYVAHSTFRIESEDGVIIATDYFGSAGRRRTEDGKSVAIIPTVSDVRVELVFDPPWNQSMMSDEARLQTGLM